MEKGLLITAYNVALKRTTKSCLLNCKEIPLSIMFSTGSISLENYPKNRHYIKYKSLEEDIDFDTYTELRNLTLEKKEDLENKEKIEIQDIYNRNL